MAVSPVRATEVSLQVSNVSPRQQLTTRIQNATDLPHKLAESIAAYAARHLGDEEWLRSFQAYGGRMHPFPLQMTMWRCLVNVSAELVLQCTQKNSVVKDPPVPSVYRNNLKNPFLARRLPEILMRSERPLPGRQGASEHQNFGVKPTQPKTDSSCCFGISSALYPSVTARIEDATRIPSTLVDIVSDYAIACFGALEWFQYFHQDIRPVPELSNNFFTFWNGPDPIDPTQRVRDTHLPPVFRPALLTDWTTRTTSPWHLDQLAKLVRNLPPGLRRVRCHVQFKILSQNGGTTGSASWIVMRKGVTGKNMAPSSIAEFVEFLNGCTQAGYERLPTSDDLATVLLTRYLTTGERHLGDATGVEGHRTYGCTLEHVDTGFSGTFHRAVGNFAPSGKCHRATLNLDSFGGVDTSFLGHMERADFGCVLLRRF